MAAPMSAVTAPMPATTVRAWKGTEASAWSAETRGKTRAIRKTPPATMGAAGKLAGLARGPAEDQEADRRRHGEPACHRLGGEVSQDARLEDAPSPVVEEQRAGRVVKPDHAKQEAKVADPGRDERLLRGRRRGRLVEPEADQQVRGQPHQLPAHEEEQEAVADDDAEH